MCCVLAALRMRGGDYAEMLFSKKKENERWCCFSVASPSFMLCFVLFLTGILAISETRIFIDEHKWYIYLTTEGMPIAIVIAIIDHVIM